jgi:hypothetical protein
VCESGFGGGGCCCHWSDPIHCHHLNRGWAYGSGGWGHSCSCC